MADVLDWQAEDDLQNVADFFVETEKLYMAQLWGVRNGSGNAGFSNEVPKQDLLGAITIRLDPSADDNYSYVSLTKDDVRKGDRVTLFVGAKKYNLTVASSMQRGEFRELGLTNG